MVALFNRLQARLGSRRWVLIFPWAVMAFNLVFAFFVKDYPRMVFPFYLWKDLYILLMFQQLWSQIQASLGQTEARRFYGIMYTFGALGSLVGASLPALMHLEPRVYLFSTVLIYPLLWGLQKRLLDNPIHVPMEKKSAVRAIEGLKRIQKTPALMTIALLVACMQMTSALAEYIFSKHLELDFSDTVSRTRASGGVMTLMHGLTLTLQLVVGWVSLEKWGLKRGHSLIPASLGLGSLAYLVAPSFATASLGYMGCKSIDFSVFALLKELLYAPLDKSAKYEAKSFIDIFVYRGAKTVMSLTLLAFSAIQSLWFFGLLFLALSLIWFWMVQRRLRESTLELA